jgi:hypothetical protein
MNGKKEYCVGCRDNYYNHGNNSTTGECWSFKTAKTVEKWCIDWWTPMDKKKNFWRVTTNNCHCETGSYAYLDKLPAHLI